MELNDAIALAGHAQTMGYVNLYPRACVVLADALAAAGKWEVVQGRVYIAGPMTGLPELNFPAFHAAAAELRAKGYDVINPAELNPDPTMKWGNAMRGDIRELMTCTGIYMLDGWRQSRGASLEYFLANALNLTILNERPNLTVAAAAMAITAPHAVAVARPGADSSTLGGAGV